MLLLHERIEDDEKVVIRATKRWTIFMSVTIFFAVMVLIGILDSGQVLTTSLYFCLGGLVFYYLDRSRIRTELKRINKDLLSVTGKYFSISNPKTYTILKSPMVVTEQIVEVIQYEREEVSG